MVRGGGGKVERGQKKKAWGCVSIHESRSGNLSWRQEAGRRSARETASHLNTAVVQSKVESKGNTEY